MLYLKWKDGDFVFNNISIDHIKKQLASVKELFDPNKESYTLLNNCISNNLSAYDMLEQLNKIGNTNEYPVELQNFFVEKYKELCMLAEVDLLIKQTLDKIYSKDRELEMEMNKRNVFYTGNISYNRDFEKMTYIEKKEYLYALNKDLLAFDDKLLAVKKEKESGESFDENLNKKLENQEITGTKHNEEINKIQEESMKNVRLFTNPMLENVKSFFNYYKSNQSENNFLNVKVEYDASYGVVLDLGYKGTEVNESDVLTRCVFSDMNYFQSEIYSYLLEEHIIDGGIKGYNVEDNKLKSVNLNDENLEVVGSDDVIRQTADALDDQVVYVDSNEKENKNNKVRIRKNDFDKAGKVNVLIIAILMVVVVFVVFAVFIFLDFYS